MSKKYALTLTNDNRIISVTYEKYAKSDAVLVSNLPDGDIHDYCYENGSFVYAPLPEPEPEPETPSQLDIIEAQVTYTAMMTDTLLESEA